jgi:hypothetical protein
VLTWTAASSQSTSIFIYPLNDDAPKVYIAKVRSLRIPTGGNTDRIAQMVLAT